MSADQFVDAVYKIKFEKAHAENIKLRAEVERLGTELSSHARALQAEAALSAQLRAENEAMKRKFDHLYRRACQVMPFGHEPNGRDDIPFALMPPAREIVLTPIRPMVELRDELVEIARLDALRKEPK